MPRDTRVGYGTAALIFNEKGELLMLQRRGSHASGAWSVPGGWVDFGETPEEAVIREVLEETGLEVKNPMFYRYTSEVHPKEDIQSLTLHFKVFRTNIDQPVKVKEPAKCAELRWVDIKDRSKIPFPLFPGLEGVIDSLRERSSDRKSTTSTR